MMLLAASPLLQDLAPRAELFAWLRSRETEQRAPVRREQLARTLVEMGVLGELPFRDPAVAGGVAEGSQAGEIDVPEVWLEWTRRWLRPRP